MNQNDKKEMEPADGKNQRPQVSGTTEAHTKQQTKPLGNGDESRTDQEEGDMHNGELGADIEKEI